MQSISANEGIQDNVFVVTGGLGFVGAALCLELVRRGARQVRAFDIRTTSPWSDDLKNHGVHCIQGDVVSKIDVERALRGADCVFHLASYGMCGKEMLQIGRVDDVNINGTCRILDACGEFGIKRLVYMSTCNVVFGGQEIVNGNETLPYFPLDNHVDPYSRSKSIAEQLVLKSNGRATKERGKCVYTCAIRPGAIYGPGEEKHFPRIVSLAKLKLLLFRIGEANVKTDWVFVDNLVLALILASKGLLDKDNIPGKGKHPTAAGQPYFISDGSPVNSFEFIRPLLKSLDCNLPKASSTFPHALVLGRIFMAVYTVLYTWLNQWWLPRPLILPAETYKVGVTHYFSNLKAKEELGYIPKVTPQEGMASTITYWQERKRQVLDDGPSIYAWVYCVIAMTSLFAAVCLPDFFPVPLLRSLCLFFFGSMREVRKQFFSVFAFHGAEAIYAWHLAKRVDPANRTRWFWQTCVCGMFVLRFLLRKARNLGHVSKTWTFIF